jgi:EAL and modified HD-GYP domain-containing signal transduction protein
MSRPKRGGQDVSLEQAVGSVGEVNNPASRPGDHVHVGRQTIYSLDGEVYGYEILFRDASGVASFDDPQRATSQVLVNTFLEIGLDQLVGDKPAFVNVTKPFLTGALPIAAPPGQVVLEIVEDVVWDEPLHASVAALAEQGYRIALDHFTFPPGSEKLLDLASYVKIDVLSTPEETLPEIVARIKRHEATPIAERVEDERLFTLCSQAGFELFQGYAFSRPQLVGGSGLSPARISCVRMLGAMLGEDVDMDELEDVLRTDPALAYRVLRLANSVGTGVRHQVSNVRQALVLVGPDQLRGWLVLMALADMGVSDPERLGWALTRARMCELLAEQIPGSKPDQAFLAGLLSSLVSLLGVEPEAMLAQVGATDELADAVRSRSGPLGQLVACAIAYEEADGSTDSTDTDVVTARRAYLSAMAWSLQLCLQTSSHL